MKIIASVLFLLATALNAHAWIIQSGFDSVGGPGDAFGCWNTTGSYSIVSNEYAPGSPSRSLQILGPTSKMYDSATPAGCWAPFPASKELWVQVWFKYKSDFDFHAIANKLIYFYNAKHTATLVIDTRAGWDRNHVNPLMKTNNAWYIPNLSTSPITAGVWHKLKFHLKAQSPAGACRDLIEYWLDDVKQAYYPDACVEDGDPSQFVEIDLVPVWGGVGDTKPEVDNYQWYDDVFVSNTTEPGSSPYPPSKTPNPPSSLLIR